MIKKGVKARGLQPEILLAIFEAREVYKTFHAELVITSLLDGKHMEGSLHYKGLAVDIRTSNLSGQTRPIAAARLKSALGAEYDVILEKDHIHIEHDPKFDTEKEN